MQNAQNNIAKVDEIIARLRVEFVESAGDQLEEVEALLNALERGSEVSADDLYDIQRNLHNIKGQGVTFGFPLVGRIAHLMEDYLENVGGVKVQNLGNMRVFLDLMLDLLSTGEQYSPEEAEAVLRGLPRGVSETVGPENEASEVEVLLVMPAGVQRRMVATELLSYGFQVNRAYTSLEALSLAFDLVPDIVVVNYDMAPFSGRELGSIFASLDKLRDVHVALCTSYDEGDDHLKGLPERMVVIEKGKNFSESLNSALKNWKYLEHSG